MRSYVLLALIALCVTTCRLRTEEQAQAKFKEKQDLGSPGSDFAMARVAQCTVNHEHFEEKDRATVGSQFAKVSKISISIPAKDDPKMATIEFSSPEGILDHWTISQGMDLYSRVGKLSSITGGIFEDDYSPIITIRTFFKDYEGKPEIGFVELKEAKGRNLLSAKAQLICIF